MNLRKSQSKTIKMYKKKKKTSYDHEGEKNQSGFENTDARALYLKVILVQKIIYFAYIWVAIKKNSCQKAVSF